MCSCVGYSKDLSNTLSTFGCDFIDFLESTSAFFPSYDWFRLTRYVSGILSEPPITGGRRKSPFTIRMASCLEGRISSGVGSLYWMGMKWE